MTVDNINRRLDKLAARYPDETPRRMIQLIATRDEGETSAQAIARWRVENPDKPPIGDSDFIVLIPLVSPNAKRE
jgi:hypothetical protein